MAHDGIWRRSSFHQPTPLGDCVEVYQYGDGAIGLQDARFHGQQGREGLAKIFSPEAWAAFIAGVKAGEFDFGVTSDG